MTTKTKVNRCECSQRRSKWFQQRPVTRLSSGRCCMLRPMLNPSDSLGELIDQLTSQAQSQFRTRDLPSVVVSPYRFNPLGAHIDHQGGTVLARTLNQYSVGAYYANNDAAMEIVSSAFTTESLAFHVGDTPAGANWHRYAMASASAFKAHAAAAGKTVRGLKLIVHGTLLGSGLSSSASIILAYLAALADVNDLTLTAAEQVELCRQVENEHMGLNNGVQDQMSIVFGRRDALSSLSVTADYWNDPDTLSEVSWLVCYSGFSRELISSGFNERVSECQAAAKQLHAGAQRAAMPPLQRCHRIWHAGRGMCSLRCNVWPMQKLHGGKVISQPLVH